MAKLKGLNDVLSAEEIGAILGESYQDDSQEIEFESFLRVFLFANFLYKRLVEAKFDDGVSIGNFLAGVFETSISVGC